MGFGWFQRTHPAPAIPFVVLILFFDAVEADDADDAGKAGLLHGFLEGE